MKTCSIENCNNPIWSKGVCKNHIIKKPMNNNKIHQVSAISNKKTNSVQNNRHNQQRDMFMDIWKKRKHYSEVSGVYLGSEAMSTYFHHILPKEKYPEACFDEENIILLTLEEHSDVENDMYRYEEVNRRRNLLKLKYEH
jgi:hypothetical protein